jgi:Carboxypeptidase regulatory-like domain/TonB dependent receptor
MLSLYKRWFSMLLILACLPVILSAQSSQGRITGQVTDSSGGVIENASVTIENLGTHVKRVLETNAAGDYVAPGLEPGFYSITVQATGFSKVVRERVQIEVANDLKINFELKPGTISETVEVKDEAPLTESANAVLSGVLSNQAINELPLQGRDFQNLLPLHPGVQRDPGGGFHTLTSNGLRPDDNNFIIDGANDNDVYYGETVVNDAGISGTPASTLPLDAIQEFNTQEQPQADFGSKPGVVVNIGIKSGTDQIHGTAYYFHRNSAFDARNYFNPVGQQLSALLLHQFGASIGGPILKGKWFYFANYEGVRSKVGNPFDVDTPVTSSLIGRVDTNNIDPTEYSIVDAAAAAGCNQTPLPTTCNALSLALEKFFPINPGLTVSADDPALINYNFNNVNRADNVVFKSDFHPNDRNVITGRFIYANSNQIEEDASPVAARWLTQAQPITQVFGVDWAWVPNARWTNDVRFSYNSFYEKIAPRDSNVNPTTYGLNTGISDPRLFGFPRINTSTADFNYLGGNSSWPLWTTPSHTANYSDTVTYVRGKHSFRFGGIFSTGGVDYLRADEGRGRVDFHYLEDFIAGTPIRDWSLQFGEPARNVTMKSFGLFAQDDYRITRRVTLNLGLRYDVTYPIKEAHNLLANFTPTQGIVQVGNGISEPYQSNHYNLSPRLGVAWDVLGNGKTVVRSGFGMIFVQPSIRTFMFGGGGLNLNPSGLPKVIGNADGTTTTIPGNGNLTTFFVSGASTDLINWNTTGPIFPVAQAGLNSCSGATVDNSSDSPTYSATPCTVFAVDPHLRTPYVLNWNVNLQQELAPNLVLQIAYVANHGVKLYSIVDPNQADPGLVVSNSLYEPGDFDGTNIIAEQLARPFTTNCPTTVLGGLGKGGPCYPYISFINYLGNQSSSTYNSLQVTLTKRYSNGLYLLAGYTYGHAIDTAGGTSNLADVPQNSLNYAGEKASGDYDIRHRFTFSATYELPSKKSWAQMLEGWQITSLVTLQGGYPVSFYDSGNDFTATGEGELNAGNDRWNILGSPSAVHFNPNQRFPLLDPTDPACQRAVNGDPGLETALEANGGCFSFGSTVLYPNAPGTYGNIPRNFFHGLPFYDWDASVGKTWRLTERFKLQFRGEVFNLLNHPIFSTSSIKKDLYSSSFGEIRGTPDVWAANPVIGSGGSRHIQLGLKIIW